MVSNTYRYTFRRNGDLSEAEATLHLALVAAEGLFGEPRVRMDGRYGQDRQARTLTVDASTPVGIAINAVFTAFVLREFGEDGFTVRRHCRAPSALIAAKKRSPGRCSGWRGRPAPESRTERRNRHGPRVSLRQRAVRGRADDHA